MERRFFGELTKAVVIAWDDIGFGTSSSGTQSPVELFIA
jgi:hypothetical protein